MKTIRIFEGAPFEGVTAYAVPAVGVYAVRSKSGPCELVATDGTVAPLTASTLTELCYRVRAFPEAGPLDGPALLVAAEAAMRRDAGLLVDLIPTTLAPLLMSDVIEELTGETLVVLPKSTLTVTTHSPDPARAQSLRGGVDPDPMWGATTTRMEVGARPGSMLLYFPDGRPLALYPDRDGGWTPRALFKVAARMAAVVFPKPLSRSVKTEVARSSLHGVCVYRISGTVGEHIVAPGDDTAPSWSLTAESRPCAESIEVLDATVAQLCREVEQYGESTQYADWSAELRARAHVQGATWPTLEDRLTLTRMEAQRFGLDDTKVWTKLDRSRPISTPRLRDCMKEVSRRTQPIVSKITPDEGIAMLIGQTVFGRPSVDDLERVYEERNRGESLHRHVLTCDLEPLRPELLGTVAGVTWGSKLALAAAQALADLTVVSLDQHPGHPFVIDPRPLLELFPLRPILSDLSERATAIFSALARSPAAKQFGDVALRVMLRAPGVHVADAWAYAMLVAIVEQLGMWRPALIMVPRPWDYLPALIALDNGYRYVSDRKYDSSAMGFGLESYIGGKMPAAEKT